MKRLVMFFLGCVFLFQNAAAAAHAGGAAVDDLSGGTFCNSWDVGLIGGAELLPQDVRRQVRVLTSDGFSQMFASGPVSDCPNFNMVTASFPMAQSTGLQVLPDTFSRPHLHNPLPSALCLLGTGLMGLVAFRRRRQQTLPAEPGRGGGTFDGRYSAGPPRFTVLPGGQVGRSSDDRISLPGQAPSYLNSQGQLPPDGGEALRCACEQ